MANEKLLTTRLKRHFDPSIRMRGQDYYRVGYVTPKSLVPFRKSFSVRGSGPVYDVELHWVSRTSTLVAECTCPYYKDGSLCKHIWACLLFLDGGKDAEEITGGEIQHRYESVADRRPPTTDRSLYWKQSLESVLKVKSASELALEPRKATRKNSRIAYYVIDTEETRRTGKVNLFFYHREVLRSGELGVLKKNGLYRAEVELYSEPFDREMLAFLVEMRDSGSQAYGSAPVRTALSALVQFEILEKLANSGRLLASHGFPNVNSLMYMDAADPWKFSIDLREEVNGYRFFGMLERRDALIPISDASWILESGLILFNDSIGRFTSTEHFSWIAALRTGSVPQIPRAEGTQLIALFHQNTESTLPMIRWPENLKLREELGNPEFKLQFSSTSVLRCALRFIYGSDEVSTESTVMGFPDLAAEVLWQRNLEAEAEAFAKLQSLTPLPLDSLRSGGAMIVDGKLMSTLARAAISWGWKVEAMGRAMRMARPVQVEVTSGVDWFDVKANAGFESSDSVLTLPALLLAAKRGEHWVPLSDGSLGLLPEEWLKKHSYLSGVGESNDTAIRMSRREMILFAAGLKDDDAIRGDAGFSQVKNAVKERMELPRAMPSAAFKAELRPYQETGLAWLQFLQTHRLGGILADDMGLGKTVQVLAHLEKEHGKKKRVPPSLIVVPKSLLFNWQEEAARFAPKLSVEIYAGKERATLLQSLEKVDLLLVTYATLRQDFDRLEEIDFHYVVTDEAQAIKNSGSLSFACCKALRSNFRIAMTGTPVENSVSDLFSLIDFTNPGMLSRNVQQRFQLSKGGDEIASLAKALSLFILRRKKDEVLLDLPEKTEKVIYCELEGTERTNYDRLRDHYKMSLGEQMSENGLARSKIYVLEALLRLRQAACHPGLIDRQKMREGSAKVDTLVERLLEIREEGHKSLVFSQFTTFLDIAEKALERKGIRYLRLDGKTSSTDRQIKVREFQECSDPVVFLISLKAGGVGLNLTAAEYVFILDPWWNPAAESQAIDRAHRIGQKNKVIAYRLIAKDTVEEKIIQLQAQKRGLADSLISSDESLLKGMTEKDLEVLFS